MCYFYVLGRVYLNKNNYAKLATQMAKKLPFIFFSRYLIHNSFNQVVNKQNTEFQRRMT